MNSRLAAFALLLAVNAANAATVCRITAAGGLAFGNYDILATMPSDSLMNVTVLCARDGGPQHVPVTVALGAGANGSSVNARRMLNSSPAGGHLAYGLYRDVARVSVWGDSVGVNAVTQTISVPNKGFASGSFVVYGRIAPQQDVAVGSYSDTVQVTLSP